MNIIISKLLLPCDMKYEISQYCYDNNGYTGSDLIAIENEKNKKRNKFMKIRHKLELAIWYKWNWTVSYLRVRGVYGKKSTNEVFGGGTSAETQHLRYYNGITSDGPSIGDDKNTHIIDMLCEGDHTRIARDKLQIVEK